MHRFEIICSRISSDNIKNTLHVYHHIHSICNVKHMKHFYLLFSGGWRTTANQRPRQQAAAASQCCGCDCTSCCDCLDSDCCDATGCCDCSEWIILSIITYTQKVYSSTNFHLFRKLRLLILKVGNFTLFFIHALMEGNECSLNKRN